MLLQIKHILLIIIYFCIISFSNAEDLIALGSGGKAIHWTSEKYPFITKNIIDNNINTYWVSSGNILPHVLTFSLPSNKRFEALSFISKTNHDRGTWAKHIRVSSADPFPHMGGWEILAEIDLPETGDEKYITVDAKRGRYFRLEIFSTHDQLATEASFNQFKVVDVNDK
ncbi:MAG: hypothetical protein CMJ07_05125 [Pelagibacterales bacterium]|nr:hypothetical protein [Pelagibacterales bacterium]OUV27459.1 MAG: hypothetical protein CBC69_03460 [Alphaproteobacteria bacterium TMED109]